MPYKSKEQRKLFNKNYYLLNRNVILNQKKEYQNSVPWRLTLKRIHDRCNNKNNQRYKDYGGRGIKCFITEEELKELWFRDKAYEMKRPSIDRINNNGNYIYDNCQFIELAKNSSKNKKKPILQCNDEGIIIKIYPSLSEASREINRSIGSLCLCLQGKRKHVAGYKWCYKEEITCLP
jgi:hypothetical protein